jgi:VanZ family protein
VRSVTHAVWVWGPAVFLMIAIFVFSSFSEVPVPLGGSSDLTVHGVVYALLGILMVRGLARGSWRGVTTNTLSVAVLLTIFYGFTDEYHQSFVPGRVADIRDVIADAFGACSGAVGVWLWGIVFLDKREEEKRYKDDI